MLEHAFKLYKVLDGQLPKLVDIDKMQYRIMLEKGTVNDLFILMTLAEKFKSKNKKLILFASFEKAFDKVSREVTCFTLK